MTQQTAERASDVRYAVVDPSSGTQVRSYPTATNEQVRAAVAAAHGTFQQWSRRTSVADRAALIRRVAELHLQRRDDFAATIVREMGKPLAEAVGEVEFSAAIYTYYADNAGDFLADEPLPLMEGEGSAVVRRQPLGVLLGIMPWNYPAYQVARFAGPNLAAGNTIVLKHAPQCPESAATLEAIFRDAGFPEGAYVNVYATNDQIADIIADPRVQGISLTGSERAGSAVAEIAGRNLKKVVLELGGSDPFIVLSTDDLDATVETAVAMRMENTGQMCSAAKRMIVHEDLYDAFVAKFTEKMLGANLSPLSSLSAAERLEHQVEGAVRDGASLATAGSRDGMHFPAGVLTGVERGSAAYGQEFFGPVAMVFKVRDENEAVAVANDTPYGLGSFLFTTDAEQARRVADRIEAGMVFINGVGDGPELPFGGIKRSGFGRELGRAGIEEFLNRKLVRTFRRP